MTPRTLRLASLALLLGVGGGGCGGYRPVRWPSSDLWKPTPAIELSTAASGPGAFARQQQDVSVRVDFLDAERSRELLHVNLLRHGIQPALVTIKNRSEAPYRFKKDRFSVSPIPASNVAKHAYQNPLAETVSIARWVILFVPGLTLRAVIEPATLDFPELEALTRRPSLRRDILADFVTSEIPDRELAANDSLSGLLFLPRIAESSPVTLTLTDARNDQPLAFVIPGPSAHHMTEAQAYVYAQPAQLVREAIARAAKQQRWTMTAGASNESFELRKRMGPLFFKHETVITLALAETPDKQLQVTAQIAGRPAGAGTDHLTLSRFFRVLDRAITATPRT